MQCQPLRRDGALDPQAGHARLALLEEGHQEADGEEIEDACTQGAPEQGRERTGQRRPGHPGRRRRASAQAAKQVFR